MDHDVTLALLVEQDVLPEDRRAVFVGGSIVQGLGNARSDVDVYVVVDEAPHATRADQIQQVRLDPAYVPAEVVDLHQRRWDIEYWRDDQVDQLLAKVDRSHLAERRAAGSELVSAEIRFLNNLAIGDVLAGEQWSAQRREQLRASAFQSMLCATALEEADNFVEDALGNLESGDSLTAALAARRAFELVVDAALMSRGQWGIWKWNKWQARMMQAIEPDVLPFARYWAIVTMQRLGAQTPAKWAIDTLRLCQTLSIEVDVG
jgi:hypothetical protein